MPPREASLARAEEVDEIAVDHVEAPSPTLEDGVGVTFDSTRLYARFSQEEKELPAAASHVGHWSRGAEDLDITREPLPNVFAVAPEAILEGRVDGIVHGLACSRLHRRWRRLCG